MYTRSGDRRADDRDVVKEVSRSVFRKAVILLHSVTEYQMTGIIWIWNGNNLCSGKNIYRKNPPHGA